MSGADNTKPGWAARINALRGRHQISQSELGRRMNYSAMAVSRWERGLQEPPVSAYIQLGNLVGDPECWYFWGRAGLHSEDLKRVLPAAWLSKPTLPILRVVQAGVHRKSEATTLVG